MSSISNVQSSSVQNMFFSQEDASAAIPSGPQPPKQEIVACNPFVQTESDESESCLLTTIYTYASEEFRKLFSSKNKIVFQGPCKVRFNVEMDEKRRYIAIMQKQVIFKHKLTQSTPAFFSLPNRILKSVGKEVGAVTPLDGAELLIYSNANSDSDDGILDWVSLDKGSVSITVREITQPSAIFISKP